MELENEHLSRFSLTWELLNKFLHQSTIYSDPIIQTNVPIFISQLRSLYSDKEHEGKYTELVRGFLDFDVEMSNIVPLWSNSEKLLSGLKFHWKDDTNIHQTVQVPVHGACCLLLLPFASSYLFL